ncbi:MAG: type III polyketide synthase [Elusimicrobia bacterium]|nr:type III polyketide synthase [Elusimicrobiota bacterium]
MARILSAATALPGHRFSQAEIEEECRHYFPKLMADGGQAILEHAGVAERRLVESKEYYRSDPTFEKKNRDYLRHALGLAEACIRDALGRAGKEFGDIGHIVSVTTTGLLTPSLEAHLAQALPFSRSVKRTPLFGIGCAGGVVGLARAAEVLAADPRGTSLLLSVELCSLTFAPNEDSMTQLVAAALFGDGAAAVVLEGGGATPGSSPVVVGAESLLLPHSLGVMGWDFTDAGMRLVLSPEAPRVIADGIGPAVDGFLSKSKVRRDQVSRWLFHPGSLKIIEAFRRALRLSADEVSWSKRFLSEHGNISSASILFILADLLAAERPPSGTFGVVGAMGPGFACELVLIRFP